MPTPTFTPEQLAAARKLLPDWEVFCPYETAAKMKELGYDELTPAVFIKPNGKVNIELLINGIIYRNSNCELLTNAPMSPSRYLCAAPTLAQAARWLREKHRLHPSADTYADGKWINQVNGLVKEAYLVDTYPTYEDALLAAIDRALEIVEQRQKEEE